MSEPFFTIGHSNRTLEAFVGLLVPNEVKLVVDVRTVPRSRANPQYNKDSLPISLREHGIDYLHLAELGGLRARDRSGLPPELNGFWENQSFHNYADYAMTPAFHEGLRRLVELGSERRCAYMCAEAVWWRCHRRIITDYLLAAGHEVFHIVSGDVPEPARLTPDARPIAEGLAYPARQGGLAL
ncbi:MAG TPA: DUF488 domain-containing protein [Usitatibacter sp.]|nr:DUF488 domain-containing protein [Usitatibacter sp.]